MSEGDEMGGAHFKVVHATDGRFHWELINPHGTPMGRSMGTFDTEDETVANVEYVKRVIERAPVWRS